MKNILLALLVSVLLAFVSNHAYASGGGPCCIDIFLDKTVYRVGDTVKITVTGSNDFENYDGTASLKIFDIMWGMDNPTIIYQEEKSMKNGNAEFTYKVTQNNSYRFLASIGTAAGVRSSMFFTNNNADKIIVSDLFISDTKIRSGEELSISVKVNDGNGKYIPYVQPEAYLVPINEGESYGTTYLYYDEPTKSYTGKLKIPSFIQEMRQYQLNVAVQIPYSDISQAFSVPDIITKEIEVLESGVIDACTKWRTENCVSLKEIVIKDVKLEKTSAKPGELVKIDISTTDENGKPVNVMSGVRLPYKACWGDSATDSVGGYDKSLKAFRAELTIPDQIPPGEYQLTIGTELLQDTKISGMTKVPFTVIRDESKVYGLFDQWSFPNDFPGGSFRLGETIHYTGKTIYGDCSTPLPNQNVKLDIIQIFDDGTQNAVSQRETTSDAEGNFEFLIEMNDRNGCRYDFVLSTEYNGFSDKVGGGFSMQNHERFNISEEGKDFVVDVIGNCSVIDDFDFDKEAKKMTIVANTSDPMRVIQARFAHELLDGEFTVFVNGEPINPPPIGKSYEYSELWWRQESNQTDKAVIEIFGTSAIPEFDSLSSLILTVSLILAITIFTKFRKNL